MTERYISFRTPMVQAIRDGKKTQTRRIVTGTALEWLGEEMFTPVFVASPENDLCPYGYASDVLKVREAVWMWCEKVQDGLTPTKRPKFRYVTRETADRFYVADWPKEELAPMVALNLQEHGREWCWRLKIPRFVPAWAVRTQLRIESLRVERLNDISEADAKCEGVDDFVMDEGVPMWRSAYEGFSELWESIHGEGSWNENPWVWVINFTKL